MLGAGALAVKEWQLSRVAEQQTISLAQRMQKARAAQPPVAART